jgi:long-chain acyl-CoA synthetase
VDVTGVELRQGYGLTEASPVSLFNRLSRPNVRGTLGEPFPGVSVSIRDAEAHAALAPGSRGEICVRGDNVFTGYLHGATDGLAVHDGWLYTGDEGRENPDGTFSFLGIRKPMFTRNGFNIYPRELERAIGELPGVTRVRVHAIPEPARENDIGVEVWGAVAEADVRRWCESQLSGYKQPSVVEVRRPDA